jgi:hypothetical protein
MREAEAEELSTVLAIGRFRVTEAQDPGSDHAVAIAGTAVVVAIVIATIALRDSVRRYWR